jgi:tetrathionate reductase subunit B
MMKKQERTDIGACGAEHERPHGRRAVLKVGAFGALAAYASVGEASAGAKSSNKRKCYGMVIDLRRCIGCHACTVACKSEFNVPLGVWRAWVIVKENGEYPHSRRSFTPKLCNNCRNSPCIKICPTGASYYNENDISSIDEEKCIGCKLCIQTCPYKQRFINPDKKTADKCTLCMHRVRKGLVPSCVNTCVGRARIFGDFNDPDSEVSELVRNNKVSVLKPELGTKPQVYYIGDLDQ